MPRDPGSSSQIDSGEAAQSAAWTLAIVVGAHPDAERADRPLAYALAARVRAWSADRRTQPPLEPLVCSDLWYLNDEALRARPTIAIGHPGVNALSAHLGDKLPTAFVVDERRLVQLDPEFMDIVACCWGVDEAETHAAVDDLCERFLEAFLDAADARVREG